MQEYLFEFNNEINEIINFKNLRKELKIKPLVIICQNFYLIY